MTQENENIISTDESQDVHYDVDGNLNIDFSFVFDYLSKKLLLISSEKQNHQYWGVVIVSKITTEPIIAVVYNTEENLDKCFQFLEANPVNFVKVKRTIILGLPMSVNEHNESQIDVKQVLSVSNIVPKDTIERFDYYPIDENEVTALLIKENNLINNIHNQINDSSGNEPEA